MSIQNAVIAVTITAIGAVAFYLYDKEAKKKEAQLATARAVVESLIKDVPGFNKPSR